MSEPKPPLQPKPPASRSVNGRPPTLSIGSFSFKKETDPNDKWRSVQNERTKRVPSRPNRFQNFMKTASDVSAPLQTKPQPIVVQPGDVPSLVIGSFMTGSQAIPTPRGHTTIPPAPPPIPPAPAIVPLSARLSKSAETVKREKDNNVFVDLALVNTPRAMEISEPVQMQQPKEPPTKPLSRAPSAKAPSLVPMYPPSLFLPETSAISDALELIGTRSSQTPRTSSTSTFWPFQPQAPTLSHLGAPHHVSNASLQSNLGSKHESWRASEGSKMSDSHHIVLADDGHNDRSTSPDLVGWGKSSANVLSSQRPSTATTKRKTKKFGKPSAESVVGGNKKKDRPFSAPSRYRNATAAVASFIQEELASGMNNADNENDNSFEGPYLSFRMGKGFGDIGGESGHSDFSASDVEEMEVRGGEKMEKSSALTNQPMPFFPISEDTLKRLRSSLSIGSTHESTIYSGSSAEEDECSSLDDQNDSSVPHSPAARPPPVDPSALSTPEHYQPSPSSVTSTKSKRSRRDSPKSSPKANPGSSQTQQLLQPHFQKVEKAHSSRTVIVKIKEDSPKEPPSRQIPPSSSGGQAHLTKKGSDNKVTLNPQSGSASNLLKSGFFGSPTYRGHSNDASEEEGQEAFGLVVQRATMHSVHTNPEQPAESGTPPSRSSSQQHLLHTTARPLSARNRSGQHRQPPIDVADLEIVSSPVPLRRESSSNELTHGSNASTPRNAKKNSLASPQNAPSTDPISPGGFSLLARSGTRYSISTHDGLGGGGVGSPTASGAALQNGARQQFKTRPTSASVVLDKGAGGESSSKAERKAHLMAMARSMELNRELSSRKKEGSPRNHNSPRGMRQEQGGSTTPRQRERGHGLLNSPLPFQGPDPTVLTVDGNPSQLEASTLDKARKTSRPTSARVFAVLDKRSRTHSSSTSSSDTQDMSPRHRGTPDMDQLAIDVEAVLKAHRTPPKTNSTDHGEKRPTSAVLVPSLPLSQASYTSLSADQDAFERKLSSRNSYLGPKAPSSTRDSARPRSAHPVSTPRETLDSFVDAMGKRQKAQSALGFVGHAPLHQPPHTLQRRRKDFLPVPNEEEHKNLEPPPIETSEVQQDTKTQWAEPRENADLASTTTAAADNRKQTKQHAMSARSSFSSHSLSSSTSRVGSAKHVPLLDLNDVFAQHEHPASTRRAAGGQSARPLSDRPTMAGLPHAKLAGMIPPSASSPHYLVSSAADSHVLTVDGKKVKDSGTGILSAFPTSPQTRATQSSETVPPMVLTASKSNGITPRHHVPSIPSSHPALYDTDLMRIKGLPAGNTPRARASTASSKPARHEQPILEESPPPPPEKYGKGTSYGKFEKTRPKQPGGQSIVQKVFINKA